MQRLSPRRLALLAAVVAILVAPPARSAAALKPWTSDDILAMRVVTDPQLSPDGRWVAYVVSSLNDDHSDYQTDVWIVPASGGPARRITTSQQADENPQAAICKRGSCPSTA